MSLSAREVQEFFERVASDWDMMRLAYYDERVIERMAAVSGLDEGMTVADVGTGTGFVAAGIAPRVGRVIAVDNSSAMLEVARKNIGDLELSNVELVEGYVGLVAAVELQVRFVEEPYLLRTHGEGYAKYASRVGRFVPGLWRLKP